MLVSLFLSWLRNDWSSYYLPVNIGGSGSHSDCCSVVVGSLRWITTASLGLIFHILASGDSVWFWGLGVGILRVQTSF